MEVLAIIPARSGSQGIPDKNIAPVGGKPLMAYTIEAALQSKYITRVVVSTDSEDFRKVARSFGAEAPFARPLSLADGSVHAIHVICHALKQLQKDEGYQPDLVVMLLPTSPFRTASSIDRGVDLFLQSDASSVVSVTLSEKQLVHFRYVKEGILVPVKKLKDYNVQRQDAPPLYVLNGSIYVSRPTTILEKQTFHLSDARALIMSQLESVDINEKSDLERANYLLKENN